MPLYDFHCDTCDKVLIDELRKQSDPPEFPCECGKGTMKMQYNFLCRLHFKGSGWFADGYCKDNAKKVYINDTNPPE